MQQPETDHDNFWGNWLKIQLNPIPNCQQMEKITLYWSPSAAKAADTQHEKKHRVGSVGQMAHD